MSQADPQSEEATLQQQLELIQQKLDEIREDMDARSRQLAAWRELQEDLSGILKEMFQSTVTELDELTPFLQTGDATALLKKLLRNTGRISQALDQFSSAEDFLADAQPIAHDLFYRLIRHLDELEQRGYFRAGSELRQIGDLLVRTADQTQLLPAVQRAVRNVQAMDPGQRESFSMWKLYRATKTPEMQRLLGLGLAFLQTLGREINTDPTTTNITNK